ncbi:MAG: hypothetical protein GVY23_03835 [Spirochaetes bacterium]|jgi:hypothetical protein|nr:hypothetical protein [Spirochaetota bacterium]
MGNTQRHTGPDSPAPESSGVPTALIVVIVLILAFMNAGADYLNDRSLQIPLFFDTIGTVVATALFGLAPGIATAVGTHLFMELLNWPLSGVYLPWMACNASSAIIVWILIRREQFDTSVHALIAGLWIALACRSTSPTRHLRCSLPMVQFGLRIDVRLALATCVKKSELPPALSMDSVTVS